MKNLPNYRTLALLIGAPLYADIPQQSAPETRPPLILNVNYIPNENSFNLLFGDNAIKYVFTRAFEMTKEAVEGARTECGRFIGEQKITIFATISQAASYVGDHKLESVLTTLLLTYSAIQARVIYLNRQLSHPQNWSLWRAETPLEEFFSVSQQQLCSELLAEVQRRYATPNTVHDVVQSLTRFIADTEREMELLKEYQQFAEWLTTLKIRQLSFIDTALLDACADRIQRISYLKGTFLGWITEYRLGIRPAGSLF